MKRKVNLSEKYGSYTPDFWQEFVGHEIYVDCKSWPYDFCMKFWGHGFQSRKTKGEIRDFKIPRGQTYPLFDIYFAETGSVYNKLDIEYVLKYSVEVPLKYHQLKATYILHLVTDIDNSDISPQSQTNIDVVEEDNEVMELGKKGKLQSLR
jgi:hypothetical protein